MNKKMDTAALVWETKSVWSPPGAVWQVCGASPALNEGYLENDLPLLSEAGLYHQSPSFPVSLSVLRLNLLHGHSPINNKDNTGHMRKTGYLHSTEKFLHMSQ